MEQRTRIRHGDLMSRLADVLDRPSPERRRYLEQLCADDATLRSLLAPLRGVASIARR